MTATGGTITLNNVSMTGGKIAFSSSGNITTGTDFSFSSSTIDTTHTGTGTSGVLLCGGGTGTVTGSLTLTNSLSFATGSIVQIALGSGLTHSTLGTNAAAGTTFDSNQTFISF